MLETDHNQNVLLFVLQVMWLPGRGFWAVSRQRVLYYDCTPSCSRVSATSKLCGMYCRRVVYILITWPVLLYWNKIKLSTYTATDTHITWLSNTFPYVLDFCSWTQIIALISSYRNDIAMFHHERKYLFKWRSNVVIFQSELH